MGEKGVNIKRLCATASLYKDQIIMPALLSSLRSSKCLSSQSPKKRGLGPEGDSSVQQLLQIWFLPVTSQGQRYEPYEKQHQSVCY